MKAQKNTHPHSIYIVFEPARERYLHGALNEYPLPRFSNAIGGAFEFESEEQATAAAEYLRDLFNSTFEVQTFKPLPVREAAAANTREPELDRDGFWNIIEECIHAGDPTAAVTRRLLGLSEQNIIRYIQIFDELVQKACTWRLWDAAVLALGGCGDDGFLDFRYSLIAKGRAVYESALANPDSLADADFSRPEDWWMEQFGYAGLNAYELKTGRDVTEIEHLRAPMRSKPSGEGLDFDDASSTRAVLPGLYAMAERR